MRFLRVIFLVIVVFVCIYFLLNKDIKVVIKVMFVDGLFFGIVFVGKWMWIFLFFIRFFVFVFGNFSFVVLVCIWIVIVVLMLRCKFVYIDFVKYLMYLVGDNLIVIIFFFFSNINLFMLE